MALDPLDLEMLLRVPATDWWYGFDVSPDSTQVAFSYNPAEQWEIFLAPLDASAPPRQVTQGPGGKFSPRWSPDGRHLTYLLDLDGSECFDIYCCDLAAERHVNLTPDTPFAVQPHYCWSPDGAQIAFVAGLSGDFRAYAMPSAGGKLRPLHNLPYSDWSVHWSPDGHWLAVVARTAGPDFDTFVVPAAGGKSRPIAGSAGPVRASTPRWSPDSTRLAFASNIRGAHDIGVYTLATGRLAWATEGEGEKTHPDWSPDGSKLAYVVTRGATAELALLDLERGTTRTYQVGPGVHYHPRFSPDGCSLVFLFENPRRPCAVWRLGLADGSFLPLTPPLPAGLEGAGLAMPEEVSYPSLDGRMVPALLYRPRQDGASQERPPAVVYVHGGPNLVTQFNWDPLVQHMVSRGWVVLAPNYRGSTGYGREWQLANRFDLGGGDTQDVVAGADYLARAGLADPARIAVTGASYGGYMTMTSLTRYPDRWAAGSAVVPFLNWFTEFASERPDLQHWDRENFGDPEGSRDLFRERSPIFFLERIVAPVQLICGANDTRCPADESIQARDVLRARGKRCDFVLYRDEGHEFLKTANLVDADRRLVDFLAEALEG
jgi:dipeptidyl aminopeptidase/acylaminoacyl peptidase